MIDILLVEKKLQQIAEYLEELKPLAEDMSIQEILADYLKYHTAERLLQLIVDTMVDINIHVIKEDNLDVPDDFQSTFITLAAHSILPRDFAEKIAPVVGLRNRIVHRYDALNRRQFIEELQKDYLDFKKYALLIEGQIKKR